MCAKELKTQSCVKMWSSPIYPPTLAASILIILISKMLKFSKKKSFQMIEICERKYLISRIFNLVKMKIPKLNKLFDIHVCVEVGKVLQYFYFHFFELC